MENNKSRIRGSLFLKAVAVMLAVVCFAACFFSAALTVTCLKNNVYNDGGDKLFDNTVSEVADSVLYRFSTGLWRAQPLEYDIEESEPEEPSDSSWGVSYDADNKPVKNESVSEAERAPLKFKKEQIDSYLQSRISPDESDYIFVMRDTEGNQLYTSFDGYEADFKKNYSLLREGYPLQATVKSSEKEFINEEFLYLQSTISRLEELEKFDGIITANAFTRQYINERGDVIMNKPAGAAAVMTTGKDGEIICTRDFVVMFIAERIIEGYSPDYFDTAYNEEIADLSELDEYEDSVLIMRDSEEFKMKKLAEIYDNYYEQFLSELNGNSEWSARITSVPSWDQLSEEEREGLYKMIVNNSAYVTYHIDGTHIANTDQLFSVDLYINNGPTHGDVTQYVVAATSFISSNSKYFPIITAASALLLIVLLVFLAAAAGQRRGSDTAVPCWFDKIPLELFAIADITAVLVLFEEYIELVYNYYFTGFVYERMVSALVFILLPFGIGLLLVLSLMTLSTRLKAKVFLKYSFTGIALWLLGHILRLCKKLFKLLGYLISKIPLAWKCVLFIPAFAIADVTTIAIVADGGEVMILFWLILWAAFAILAMTWCIGFATIKKYTQGMKNGKISKELDKKYLFGELKQHADDLECVDDGIKKAVDERMKSELLKTELIANVSHDLKTPLTSIVNYVDILSKDEIESPEAIEHIEILKHQAARMKKLIEDLVEVSKASSGNISANLERTDVNLLVTQTAAEYAQRFEDCKLELVMNMPEKKQIANLDGRLMWRILDNLYNNICKYAMPNTRVYITAEDLGASVRVSFKNISRSQLNMSGADLMERFVRGDSSRNTEGSGLGLSIAKSFCDLQKVRFDITIDGDLFKVDLLITKIPDDREPDDEVMSEYTEQEVALRAGQRNRVFEPEVLPEEDILPEEVLPEENLLPAENEAIPLQIEEKTVPREAENGEALISAPETAKYDEKSEPSSKTDEEEGGDGPK